MAHKLRYSIYMETDEEKAIRFRYRAEEIRALVSLAQDARTRQALIVVATYYENMAMVLEDDPGSIS